MPVEAKPLFRPDVLRPHLQAFDWPTNLAQTKAALQRWSQLLAPAAGPAVSHERAVTFKEQELLPDFLTDIFCLGLGYTRPADNSARYTLSREKHVQVDGKFADAVLGSFQPGNEEFLVALEGKGPLDPLDRPHAGRKMSAVDQGYRYAINLPCDWVIVTSMRQTRLYYKGTDQHTYERFDTDRLAQDDALLKRFLFLLGAERVVPEVGRCHLFALINTSEKVGKELTKDYYFQYAEMRQNAFEDLRRENPDRSPHELLSATQKLLDRILFCAFSEDRGLLPPDAIENAYAIWADESRSRHRLLRPFRTLTPVWKYIDLAAHHCRFLQDEVPVPAAAGWHGRGRITAGFHGEVRPDLQKLREHPR